MKTKPSTFAKCALGKDQEYVLDTELQLKGGKACWESYTWDQQTQHLSMYDWDWTRTQANKHKLKK